MSTLSEQIAIDLAIVIAPETLLDLTNQKDPTATDPQTDINNTLLDRTCDMAAARIKIYLGDVDGSDLQAVDIGVRLVSLMLSNHYSMTQLAPNQVALDSIVKELEVLRDMRLAEIPPQLGKVDLSGLDKVYPTTPEWNSDHGV